MDTTLIKYVLDQLPAGVSGVVTVLVILFIAHKSDFIPLKLTWGKQVKTGEFVTIETMRKNCERRQSTLDQKLETINAGVSRNSHKVDDLKDTVLERLSDHHGRISRIEGIIG